ncbi:MAG: cation/H(+) antiporter, partial [Bacteroidia bacterium]|nr:cation/H(+) antiporter [Bacteroidia bacterium]
MTKKNIFIYCIIVGIFASLIWLILEKGKTLKPSAHQVTTTTAEHNNPDASVLKPAVAIQENLFESLAENLKHPISILFLQIIVILIVSRLFGMFAHAIGQPTVIGEIIAGIFLGSS